MSHSLPRIQAQFQHYVMGTGDIGQEVTAIISDRYGLPAKDRLAIYHDAYRLRLCEALSEAFDKTHAYIGDSLFEELSLAYIEKSPSHFRNLRWFGGEFPAFVAERLTQYPMVAELAAFEWALGLAFDAADAPVLAMEALQQITPEQWEDVGFLLQPSLQILHFHWNAPAIWLALEKEENPPEAVSNESALAWMVWRKGLQPHFRSLSIYEAQALQGLAQGSSFSQVCSDAAELAEDDITQQIAGWLHGWLIESALAGVR